MSSEHEHTPDETIAAIIQPAPSSYSSQTPVGDVLFQFVEEPVILVTEAERLVGLLTKIDVLDFIAREI